MQRHLEWLRAHYKDMGGEIDFECVEAQIKMHIEEDEKQQIQHAYNVGGAQACDIGSEQYYNEKFSEIS